MLTLVLTDLVDRHVDIQTVEVVARSVAHRNSVLGPRSSGYWPPEPACRGRSMKTHFEEDVPFACDGDIALGVWESTAPWLFIASLSPTALIDGDSPEVIPQDRWLRARGFDPLSVPPKLVNE